MSKIATVFESSPPKVLERLILTEHKQSTFGEEDQSEFRAATARLLRALSFITTLKGLDLSHRYEFQDDEIETLADLIQNTQSLETLNLLGSRLNNAHINVVAEALSKNASLCSITLDTTQISHESWQEVAVLLSRHPTLKQLELFMGGNLDDVKICLNALSKSRSLETVQLNKVMISED